MYIDLSISNTFLQNICENLCNICIITIDLWTCHLKPCINLKLQEKF